MEINYTRVLAVFPDKFCASITVMGIRTIIFYNNFSKRFYGFLSDGTKFSSEDKKADPWLIKLKQFFKENSDGLLSSN